MDQPADYYARRAAEYERIYAKPERQADLAALRTRLGRLFAGRRVLELACGTGYWTDLIAGGAAGVTALDLNEAVLEIARAKPNAGRVSFVRGSALMRLLRTRWRRSRPGRARGPAGALLAAHLVGAQMNQFVKSRHAAPVLR